MSNSKGDKDLKSELSNLWRSTIDQLDEIKDTIVRSSEAGKAKLDATFLGRERDKLLAALGQKLLDAVDEGALEVPGEWTADLDRARELQEQIRAHEVEVHGFLKREGIVKEEGNAEDSTEEAE